MPPELMKQMASERTFREFQRKLEEAAILFKLHLYARYCMPELEADERGEEFPPEHRVSHTFGHVAQAHLDHVLYSLHRLDLVQQGNPEYTKEEADEIDKMGDDVVKQLRDALPSRITIEAAGIMDLETGEFTVLGDSEDRPQGPTLVGLEDMPEFFKKAFSNDKEEPIH